LLEDQEVQMSGAVVVPPGGTHEVADRPINGNGIAGRLNAAKAEMTMGVGHKFSSQIHRRLFGILLLVEPFRWGVPDVDFGALDRLAVLVLDRAINEQCRPRCWRSHDGATILRAR